MDIGLQGRPRRPSYEFALTFIGVARSIDTLSSVVGRHARDQIANTLLATRARNNDVNDSSQPNTALKSECLDRRSLTSISLIYFSRGREALGGQPKASVPDWTLDAADGARRNRDVHATAPRTRLLAHTKAWMGMNSSFCCTLVSCTLLGGSTVDPSK